MYKIYHVLSNWSLKYAVLGLKRLQKAQALGQFNYRDGYGQLTQVVRYKFRIVKVVGSSKVTAISLDEALDEIIA